MMTTSQLLKAAGLTKEDLVVNPGVPDQLVLADNKVYITIRVSGKDQDVPITWVGETLGQFVNRTGLSYDQAVDMLYQAMRHPRNTPALIEAMLAEGYQKAVET